MQENVVINDIEVPTIINDSRYYPISYTMEKLLLRNVNPTTLIQQGHKDYIENFTIEYGKNNIQETNCISEEGLIKVLTNTKVNKLRSQESKTAMKRLCEYFNLKVEINISEKFIDDYSGWLEYDFWTKECIESLLEEIRIDKWQRCGKCGRYLPYHENFFEEELNPRNKCELRTVCKECKGWNNNRGKDYIKHSNKELNRIYNIYGQDVYLLYKRNDIIKIWEWWNQSKDKTHVPNILRNKGNLLILIKYLYDNEIIKDNMINSKDIYKVCKITISNYKLLISEIYKMLLNVEIKGKDGYGVTDIQEARQIIDKYIQKKSIQINKDNIYNFNYYSLFQDAGLMWCLRKTFNNDLLQFIIEYYNYQHAPYKFKGGFEKYWTNKENRIYALKWLIEKEMNLPKDKVPLYLTLENLRKQSNTLRSMLRKYYNNNLWSWVNELYPDYFIEEDFNINVIRNVFDSAEEHMIHDILKENLKHIVYNPRNTENTVKINEMIPDWYSITDNGFYIIEYFGITNNQREYNTRVSDYKNKTNEKINKYENIDWIKKVYLYPEDLKDNFRGIKEKIKIIV